MKNISVSDLIQIVGSYSICPGINYIKDDASIYFRDFPLNNDDTNDNEDEPLIPYKSKPFVRSIKCTVLSQEKCEPCMNSEKYCFKIKNKIKIRLSTPAKLKAPLSKTDRKRVETTLIKERMECKITKQELERMKPEIEKGSIKIDQELAFENMEVKSSAKVTPFMSLF